MACLGEVKAVFWAKGVENIYFEDPETHYEVLESMEGYWIGEQEDRSEDQYGFFYFIALNVARSLPGLKILGVGVFFVFWAVRWN